MTTRNRSRWLLPAITVGLGAVILAAEATDGDLASGLIWFAVLAVLGALQAFGRPLQAEWNAEDERDATINLRAMAAAGLVLILVLTGCIVFELARGDDPSPYTQVIAVGGASYAIALLVLRRVS
jgi:hypothetical protein